jgi:large subunit ribosomal protein L25
LIDLEMPGGTRSAFVRQVQINPVTRAPIHVDFRIVDLNVEIVADVPIVAVGENRLVERGEGVLQMPLATLHVRALPGDLPQNIEVDISKIEDFDTALHVRDLDLGGKVAVLTPEDETIATLTRSRMEAEAEEVAEEAAEGEPELSGEGEGESEAE